MSAQDEHVALGQAIREARGRTTQQQLAELLGTDQTRVSKWESDKHRPSLEEIRQIEKVLDRPAGYILAKAGLIELPRTLEEQITMDPRLTDPERAALLGSLSGLLGAKQT